MERNETNISITVKKVMYDTALSEICFWYDTKSSEVSNVRVWSNFMYTDKSTKKWFDDCSYGQCFFIPENEDEWKELVECIKDKEWIWTRLFTSKDEKILDEGQKEKIIQQMMKNIK